MAFWYIWLWAANVVTIISMYMIYRHVSSVTKKSLRFSVKSVANQNIGKVATQGLLYICAFLMTTLPASIVRFMQMANQTPPMFLFLVVAIFIPMQGFWNFLIYMRPRYIQWRERHPEWSSTRILSEALQKTICCGSDKGLERDETENYQNLEIEKDVDMFEFSEGVDSRKLADAKNGENTIEIKEQALPRPESEV